MLAQRVVTAVVGIPILLGALYLGGTAWRLLVALIVVLGLWEFASLGAAGLYLDFLALSGLSFLAVTYSGVDGTKLLLWFALQLIYYLLRASFGGMRNFAAAANLLGVFYVAALYSFFLLVRSSASPGRCSGSWSLGPRTAVPISEGSNSAGTSSARRSAQRSLWREPHLVYWAGHWRV